jgi:putative endopeptidase
MRSNIRKSQLDNTVHPGDDFYLYVNNRYIQKKQIPSDQVSVGAFQDLAKGITNKLVTICKNNSKEKFGLLYNQFMDKVKLNKDGKAYLAKFLPEFQGVENFEQLTNFIVKHTMDFDLLPFSLSIDVNPLNPDEYILDMSQDGLTLPDESYYHEPQFEPIRQAYLQFLGKFFKAAKIDGKPEDLLKFETEIASYHWDLNTLRDIDKIINLVSVKEAIGLTKNIDLEQLLKVLGLSKYNRQVNLSTTKFLQSIDKFWNAKNYELIKLYATFHFYMTFQTFLPGKLTDITFDFFGKILSGQQKRKPRPKRAVSVAESLGEDLSQFWLKENYSEQHQLKMNALIDNLQKAYEKSINSQEWLTPETKKQAVIKLKGITRKIGHPKKFEDYSKLELVKDSLIENSIRIDKFEHQKALKKIDKKVDRTKWEMFPHTVNAYYNPVANEIVFPAAILQPPFFDPTVDDAENYGSIGAVIGHEIGHAFDDQGSKFDVTGAKKNWWTKSDEEKFKKLGNKLVKYYNGKKVDPKDEIGVDGKRTLGENIGDLGGLSISLKAYKMTESYKEGKTINGLTPLQRFFIAYAKSWCGKQTEEYRQLLLANDVHSPHELRSNLVVALVDDWYEAFGVTTKNKLYVNPADRIAIW